MFSLEFSTFEERVEVQDNLRFLMKDIINKFLLTLFQVFQAYGFKSDLRACSHYTLKLSVALRNAYWIELLFKLKMNYWARFLYRIAAELLLSSFEIRESGKKWKLKAAGSFKFVWAFSSDQAPTEWASNDWFCFKLL